jgi:predicted DNA-binding transcriptional regulator AlpA
MNATMTMSLEDLTRGHRTLLEAVQRLQRLVLNVPRLHKKDVQARYGWSRATLDRKIASGHFPKPVRFGGQPLWRLDDLETAETGGQLPRPASG